MKKIILITFVILKVMFVIAQERPSNSQTVTYITCNFKNEVKHGIPSLVLNGPFFNYTIKQIPEMYSPQTIVATPEGDYSFKIKVVTDNSPFHATLFLSSKRNDEGFLVGTGQLSNYLISPGSDIQIDFDTNNISFSGKGAEVLKSQYEIENFDKDQKLLNNDDHGFLTHNPTLWLKEKDSLLNAELNILSRYKAIISPLNYSIIHADIIGLNRGSIYQALSFTPSFLTDVAGKRLTKEASFVYDELKKNSYDLDLKDNACLSPKYVYYLYEKIKIGKKYDRIASGLPPYFPEQNYFENINKSFSGVLKDKILARWIIEIASVNNLRPEFADSALAVMKAQVFIKMVENLNATYKRGETLKDFDFKDSKGKIVRLADFRGKVVVVDMWFTGCGACKRIATALPLVEEKFKGKPDVVFVSLSIDTKKETWLKSINKNDGKYYVTSKTVYLYTSGTGGKNPFIEKYVPSGEYPQQMIIDKNGKIFTSVLPRPLNEKLRNEFISLINKALLSKS